jgi:hypothetical protein
MARVEDAAHTIVPTHAANGRYRFARHPRSATFSRTGIRTYRSSPSGSVKSTLRCKKLMRRYEALHIPVWGPGVRSASLYESRGFDLSDAVASIKRSGLRMRRISIAMGYTAASGPDESAQASAVRAVEDGRRVARS